MHYVPGHEVASHITQEAKSLAYSTTIPWNVVRETPESGSYSCQVGDIVAIKIVGLFDCPPEALTECVVTELGAAHHTSETVLEEYDRYNQIIFIKMPYAALQTMAGACVFRYVTVDKDTNTHYIGFQSVDHDAISSIHPEECILFNYAPSACIIAPIPNDPNKCKMIYVSQMLDLEHQTSKEFVQAFCATAGSLGQVWEEFRHIALSKRPMSPVSHQTSIEDMRRELYINYYELSASKDWKPVSRTWFDLFMKEEGNDHVSIAVRSRSFVAESSCRTIAARVYDTIRHATKWHWVIEKSEILKEIDESSCIVKLTSSAVDGGPTETTYLVSCRENIDGVCDVAWKSIDLDEFPIPSRVPQNDIAASGCIISPNGHGATLQWLVRIAAVPKHFYNTSVGRTAMFTNAALSYIINPAEYSPEVAVNPLPEDQIKHLPENIGQNQLTTISMKPKKILKRKLAAAPSPSLLRVDNMVVKIVAGEQPARPFLFLVSNLSETGKRHRFIRRRWDSAISRSTFDLLPPELLEYILSFLDVQTLLCTVPSICTKFKEFLETNALWKQLYHVHWGPVEGRLALRYCGDDDPSSFFTSNFPYWREVFWEREHIERAWREPDHRAHGFRVSSGHSRDIRALVLMPQCHRIVTGSLDKLVRVWDVHSGACVSTMHGSAGVVALSVADNTQIKAGYKTGVVRLVDLARMESVWEMRLAEAMRGCTFSDNRVATWDEDVELWDQTTQQRLHTFIGHTACVTDSAFFSPSLLLSSSRDKTVQLWDTTSGRKVSSMLSHSQSVNGIAVMKQYNFVSVSSDSTMRVWDIRRPDAPLCVRSAPSGKIKCVKYSFIGNKICAGGTNSIQIWEGNNFESLRSEHAVKVESIAVDEERMVYGAAGGVIRFYDFAPRK